MYPKAILVVRCQSMEEGQHSNQFFQDLRKAQRFDDDLLVITSVEPNIVKKFEFEFLALEGDINPVSGGYEVAQHIVDKLSDEEQQKLYEHLHTIGHRIYRS